MGISQQIGSSSLSKPGVCTSSTRPATPYEGQMISETDTDKVFVWNASAWKQVPTAATAGAVLQVVQTVVNTTTSTSSATLTDISGLSVSITPSASTNKVLVTVNMNIGFGSTADDTFYTLLRGSTSINIGSGGSTNSSAYARGNSSANQTLAIVPIAITYLDSPATTSATTYKMQWATRVDIIYLNKRGSDNNFITSSTITAQEISA